MAALSGRAAYLEQARKLAKSGDYESAELVVFAMVLRDPLGTQAYLDDPAVQAELDVLCRQAIAAEKSGR